MLRLAQLQVKLLQVALCCEAASDFVYVRDSSGRFAKTSGTTVNELALPTVASREDFAKELKNIVSESEKFDNLKAGTYKALNIKNPDVVGSTFMTGFGAPDIIQDAVFSGLKGVAGISSDNIKNIVNELESSHGDIDALIDKYSDAANDPPAQFAQLMVGKYLGHKKALDDCTKIGTELVNKDIATQLDCLNAFSMEAALKVGPLLGMAVLPELVGAAGTGTLEGLILKLNAGIANKAAMGAAANETKKALDNANASDVAIGLASGLMVGGAVKEVDRAIAKHPVSAQKALSIYDELKSSVGDSDELIEELQDAIEQAGGSEAFRAEAQDELEVLRDTFEYLPPKQQQMFKTMAESAGGSLKDIGID